MTDNVLLAVCVATWVVMGLAVALLMGRRGHDFVIWALVGLLMGPFLIPFAVERVRYHEQGLQSDARRVFHEGRFDVLAGLDGSEEGRLALETALTLFGETISTVTLVRVLDYDSKGTVGGVHAYEGAIDMLADVSERLGLTDAETQVLFGSPAEALIRRATETGIELIVVGARGRGASEALLGSVTSRLVGASVVPIFVGPSSEQSPVNS